jgi:hypothetical protein
MVGQTTTDVIHRCYHYTNAASSCYLLPPSTCIRIRISVTSTGMSSLSLSHATVESTLSPLCIHLPATVLYAPTTTQPHCHCERKRSAASNSFEALRQPERCRAAGGRTTKVSNCFILNVPVLVSMHPPRSRVWSHWDGERSPMQGRSAAAAAPRLASS